MDTSKDIAPDTFGEIDQAYDAGCMEFRGGVDRGLPHLVKFGQLLEKLKADVGHGHFGKLIKEHAKFSHRTANYWMQIAALPESQRVAKMSMRKLLGLDRARPDAQPDKAHSQATTPSATPAPTAKAKQAVKAKPAPPVISEVFADPTQGEWVNEADSLQERWQRSAGNLLGDIIAMEPYWTREFGAEWRAFDRPPSLVILAKQAAEAWNNLAKALNPELDKELSAQVHEPRIKSLSGARKDAKKKGGSGKHRPRKRADLSGGCVAARV